MFQRFKKWWTIQLWIGTDTDRRYSPQLQKERSGFSRAVLQYLHVFARYCSEPRLYSTVWSAIRSGCRCLTLAIFRQARQGVFLPLPGKMGYWQGLGVWKSAMKCTEILSVEDCNSLSHNGTLLMISQGHWQKHCSLSSLWAQDEDEQNPLKAAIGFISGVSWHVWKEAIVLQEGICGSMT